MNMTKKYYSVNRMILGERSPGSGRVNYAPDANGSVTGTVVAGATQNLYAYKPYGGLLSPNRDG